jgi:TPR repeat protein
LRAAVILAISISMAAVLAPVGASPVHAAACSSADIVAGYGQVMALLKAKKHGRALPGLKRLADAGHGPAQRNLAIMLRDGEGLPKSKSGAALWSELAFRSGDKAAKPITRKLRAGLDEISRAVLDERLKAWRVARLSCNGGKFSALPVKAGDDGAALIPGMTLGRLVDDRGAEIARRRFPEIIQAALAQYTMARIYLDAVDGYEFYTGGRYHRYAGWKKNKSKNIMRVPTNVFNDKSPKYFAHMVILTAKRKLYAQTPDAEFDDPLVLVIGGIKVYGSVYPDIRNGRFFQAMRKAFVLAKQLRPPVTKYIEIIDEIHYNPISKHFNRSGAADAAAAYYNKILSFDGQRMMFVRRNVLYGSPLFFMQTFVHEGTHAVQDQRAERYNREVPKLKRRLSKLHERGQGKTPRANRVKKDIDVKFDYVSRWYRGVLSNGRRIADMAFECEATEKEILAVKAVDGSPGVMRASGYLKLCPEAQRMLVQWQNELPKGKRR